MKITATQILAVGAVVIGGGVVLLALREVKESGGNLLDFVKRSADPTSPDNLINRGVNQVGDLLDDAEDDDSFSLGGLIFDVVQRVRGIAPFDPNAPIPKRVDEIPFHGDNGPIKGAD